MSAPQEASFRPMLAADIQAVHALDKLSFSLPWPESSYRFEINENNHAVCWVAESAGQIVGMIVTWVILDEAHVATVAVHPEHRRLGIGQRLLAYALLAAWERGARTAFLEVRAGNLAAQALYADFGFEVSGSRPRYYQDNHEDALLMTLARLEAEPLRARLALEHS